MPCPICMKFCEHIFFYMTYYSSFESHLIRATFLLKKSRNLSKNKKKKNYLTNVVEPANRSQHTQLFRVQVLSFWVTVIYVLRSHLPSIRTCQGQTEHMHELMGPLARSFRKDISSGNYFAFDQLWFCKGQFCRSPVHVRVKSLK